MMHLKKPSALIVGLALFSMFFGSGNLIFPLFIGNEAQSMWFPATIGFILTGVLAPFLGVIAMVIFHGDYKRFFETLGKYGGFLLTALLLTIWIPLGSAPRCIALSYASLQPYTWLPPVWVFSSVFCLLVFLVVHHRSRIIPILGYVLTPMLLTCLAIIIIKGIFGGVVTEGDVNAGVASHVFFGIREGYNTMDLIASLFFAASIISLLKRNNVNHSSSLSLALRASLIGISLIGAVYSGLIYLASVNSGALVGVPKEQLLATIAKATLGTHLGIISSIAIVLACFTTAVAIVIVYADFLKVYAIKSFGKRNNVISIDITLIATFVMSLFGLSGITSVTAPVLRVCYPILVVLIIYNVTRIVYKNKKAGGTLESLIDE